MTGSNKEILVIPSISCNKISYNSTKENDMISWLSRAHEKPRVFQFSQSRKMRLNEFDLAGVLKRQSSHQKYFDDKMILAQD